MKTLTDYMNNSLVNHNICESFETGHYSNFSSAMNKVALYNRRQMTALGYSINESFRSRHRYNQDILFTYEEQLAINDIFAEILEHLTKSMNEELSQVEYMISEGFSFNLLKKGWEKVKDSAKGVANKVGSTIDNSKEYISNKANDIKDNIVKKYKNAIEFIKKIIDSSINSVREFINTIGKLFEKLGNCISEALSKLGAFQKDKNEESGDIAVDNKVFDDVSNENEKSFLSHVISYIAVMMGKHKDRTQKLMTESLNEGNLNDWMFDFDDEEVIEEGAVMDKIANNKFIQFILCYGKGKKISIWKSILISITGSLIISLALPIALSLAGVGAATIPVIVAAVRFVWSSRGAFKIIFNRYVNKKPEERLFDTKTIILLAICILPQIPPFKDWIASLFKKFLEWTHLDKGIEKLEEILGNLIKQLHGKNPSEVIKTVDLKKTVETKGGGKIYHTGDAVTTDAATLDGLAKAGVPSEKLNGFSKLLKAAYKATSSSGAHKSWWDTIKELGNGAFPRSAILDASKWGMNTKVLQRILDEMIKSGKYPGVEISVLNAEALQKSTNYFAGTSLLAANITPQFEHDLIVNIAKESGKDISKVTLKIFGEGYYNQMTQTVSTTVVEPVHWLFDTLVASFSPTFIPFLDKNKFKKYEMSFASNASKDKYYVVCNVEHTTLSKAESIIGEGKGDAYNRFIEYIKSIQEYHKELFNQSKEQESESKLKKFFKKFGKDQNKNYERNGNFSKRNVILFYVEAKDENGKTKEMPAIIMDPLSLMCVDVFSFKKQKRHNPYPMKGLLSKLSFRPIDDNDNDTKQFIRTTLGTTLATACKQNVSYSIGSFFVKKEDKKWVPGSDKDKNIKFNNLGNFSPNELCEILNDEDKEHKVAYSYIGGEHGSRLNMSMKDGKLKKSAKDMDSHNRSGKSSSDSRTIENKLFVKDDESKSGYRVASKSERDDDSITKYDYVDAKILPKIVNEKSTIHKKLVENEKIKKLMFKNDGSLRKELFSGGKNSNLKQFLFRPETTFSKNDEHNLKQIVNDKYDDESNPKDVYNTLKMAIEIIWNELGKRVKRTNESGYCTVNDLLIEELLGYKYKRPMMSLYEYIHKNTL